MADDESSEPTGGGGTGGTDDPVEGESGVYRGEGTGRRESVGGVAAQAGGGQAGTEATESTGSTGSTDAGTPVQVRASGGTIGDAGYGDNDPSSPDSDTIVGDEETGNGAASERESR